MGLVKQIKTKAFEGAVEVSRSLELGRITTTESGGVRFGLDYYLWIEPVEDGANFLVGYDTMRRTLILRTRPEGFAVHPPATHSRSDGAVVVRFAVENEKAELVARQDGPLLTARFALTPHYAPHFKAKKLELRILAFQEREVLEAW